jgi:hypothetical protein
VGLLITTIDGQYRSEFVADYAFFNMFSNNDVRKLLTSLLLYNKKMYNHITKYAGNGGPVNIVPINI